MRTLWLAVPFLNALQQILLKLSALDAAPQAASDTGASWLPPLLTSPWFLAAVGAEIACFGIWMTVLSHVDLAKAFPLSAVSYVLIMATAWFAFGEPIQPLQGIGSLLILAGIWLIATASRRSA